MAEDLAELGDAELEQALVDLGPNMPYAPARDLTGAVLERIAAGRGEAPAAPRTAQDLPGRNDRQAALRGHSVSAAAGGRGLASDRPADEQLPTAEGQAAPERPERSEQASEEGGGSLQTPGRTVLE